MMNSNDNDDASVNEIVDRFLGLGEAVLSWEWWQLSLLVCVLVLLRQSPNILKELGKVLNERQKNRQKHELNMQKLLNQVNSPKSKKKEKR